MFFWCLAFCLFVDFDFLVLDIFFVCGKADLRNEGKAYQGIVELMRLKERRARGGERGGGRGHKKRAPQQ